LSITGYRLGEGLVEHRDRVSGPQKTAGTEIFSPENHRTGLFRRRVILRTAAARPCRSSGCDPPPSCVASGLAPKGDFKLSQGWRLLASAVPQRCFPSVLRQLQHPRPSADPSVPFFAKNISQTPPPPLRRESICEYLVAEKTYRTGRAGDPYAGVRMLCFSKTLRIRLPDS
jgi:hypothetical protein